MQLSDATLSEPVHRPHLGPSATHIDGLEEKEPLPAAARLRRLDEEAEIVLFDRGPHVAFANCGLPYYVGNVIVDGRRLLVASRDLFHHRFNIDVRTEHEVTSIDRDAKNLSGVVTTYTMMREPGLL